VKILIESRHIPKFVSYNKAFIDAVQTPMISFPPNHNRASLGPQEKQERSKVPPTELYDDQPTYKCASAVSKDRTQSTSGSGRSETGDLYPEAH
jgi:hypothetical protein